MKRWEPSLDSRVRGSHAVIASPVQYRHVATLHWIDRAGEHRQTRYAACEPVTATTNAYRRAKSMMNSREAKAYTIKHKTECVPQDDQAFDLGRFNCRGDYVYGDGTKLLAEQMGLAPAYGA